MLLFKLHVEGKINLPLGLIIAGVGNRVLGFYKKVVSCLAGFNHLANPQPEGNIEIAILEIEGPDWRSA